ncbi:surfeit locus protein 2-like [Porites lutea]|uniref:surfeit locus protein 2-like n=1 Tax=Porites lutea TaxID=51062 RepID=UPI003CC6ACC2
MTKMADKRSLKKFLTDHPHFELFKDEQNREKVKCKLTGHELPARISDLENYTRGKKYQRLVKDVPNTSPGFEEYKEFLAPSRKNRSQLYCELTKKFINNTPHHIQTHVTGKRFLRALEKHREQQRAKDDKSDEEMWVPSDLESDSENELEEGAKRKKTEDEEDSGGEFSSEEEDEVYETKNQDTVKRTIKEPKKDKSTKKLKTSCEKEDKTASKVSKNKSKTKKSKKT